MSAPTLIASIEAALFSSPQPFTLKALAAAVVANVKQVDAALEELETRYGASESGVQLVRHDGKVQLVTKPELEPVVGRLQRQELEGELTKPSLEALSVIVYRGPIAKAELEQIRGVNCSLIIRNLLLRGLIEEQQPDDLPMPVYVVSFDYLRHLGVKRVEELPNYQKLHANQELTDFLAARAAEQRQGGGAAE